LSQEKLDTFICVHHRDVDYLLELVLRSYQINFLPKNKLIFITNDLPHLQQFVEAHCLDKEVVFTHDSDWLSRRELELPGWYRQQIIKLRAYQFCETPNFCNLGADTVLLQPLTYHDLVNDGSPILYYTHHMLPDPHYLYELRRVKNVAEILQVKPVRSRRYVDFINDLFCFNREDLIRLNGYLERLYGKDSYYTVLRDMNVSKDQDKFGEWTLYSVYLLDCLKKNVQLQNSGEGFLYQAHSQFSLKRFRFNTKVAHFVGKDFSVPYIKQEIQKYGLLLGEFC
jgi:hypothetical protein